LNESRQVNIEGFDEFVEGFNEVLNETALGDEVHHGEQEERLVRCAMAGDLGIPVPTPVGSKLGEPLELFLKHLISLILPTH